MHGVHSKDIVFWIYFFQHNERNKGTLLRYLVNSDLNLYCIEKKLMKLLRKYILIIGFALILVLLIQSTQGCRIFEENKHLNADCKERGLYEVPQNLDPKIKVRKSISFHVDMGTLNYFNLNKLFRV